MDIRRATLVERMKVDQVIALLNEVMNSDEFKERVLNFEYRGVLHSLIRKTVIFISIEVI